MNRKILGIGLSVVLAIVGVILVIAYVQEADERALEGQETVELLVVSQQVDKGEAASDIGTKVETVLVPAVMRAEGSVTSLADLEGRVAAVDLVPGEQVVASRFIEPEVLEEEEDVDIPPGLLEATLSLSPERAVGGQLQPGDTVTIVASFDPFNVTAVEPGEQEAVDGAPTPSDQLPFTLDSFTTFSARTPNASHIILNSILVTSVQIERLPAESDVEDAEESGVELAPTGNLLVTLALSAADVEKVVFSAEHGTVWLARDDALIQVANTRIQTRGTIYE